MRDTPGLTCIGAGYRPGPKLTLDTGPLDLDVINAWSEEKTHGMIPRILDSLAPWSSRASYLSMAYEAAARRGFAAEAYERLVRIRESVDPNRVFVAPRASADD